MAAATVGKAKAAHHTRRFEARRAILERIFTQPVFERVWKEYVRPGLRDQEITDLHDYNDIHWTRADIFSALREAVLSGQYIPDRSLPVEIEKRNGVSRTLVIPAAADAIILQCLVEYFLPKALARQPSRNAFWSRSHKASLPAFKFDKEYIWFTRWVKFSKARFALAAAHPIVLTTDVANFYDNVDYTHLRNMLSELDGVEEVVMDLLFMIIDTISWRPDYLPPPHRSLPQVDFDAPRLLAHVYLFEIDNLLKKNNGDRFLRWVDDITSAVGSETEAKVLLHDLDQMLMTRGLRLNAGKTHILSAAQAHRFFWSRENAKLDDETKKVDRFVSQPGRLAILTKRIETNFDHHLKADRYGHWSKVTKRYIGLLARLKSFHALPYARIALYAEPELREQFWRYFLALPPSGRALTILSEYVLSDHALDDSSIFNVAKILVNWEVTPNSQLHRRIKELGEDIYKKPHKSRIDFRFLSALWLLAKYGRAADVFNLLETNKNIWASSDFLSRQVAALLPKFRYRPSSRVLRREIERHQNQSATSVLLSLDSIVSNHSGCGSAARLYILNGQKKTKYSLPRFLVAIHVLLNQEIDPGFRTKLKADLLKYLSDPLYRRVVTAVKC